MRQKSDTCLLIMLFSIVMLLLTACDNNEKHNNQNKVTEMVSPSATVKITEEPTGEVTVTPLPDDSTNPGYPTPDLHADVLKEWTDCPTRGTQKPTEKGLIYQKYGIERVNPLEVTTIRKKRYNLPEGLSDLFPDYTINEYDQISGLKDKKLENAINQRIQDVFQALTDKNFYPKQRGIVELMRDPSVFPYVSCRVVYNSNNLLSVDCGYVLCRYTEYDEFGLCCEEIRYYDYPLNFNLETGEELCLADFVPEGEEYLQKYDTELYQHYVTSRFEEYEWYGEYRDFYYNEEEEFDSEERTPFSGIAANQKFLIEGPSDVRLLFDSDTPGTEGFHDVFIFSDNADIPFCSKTITDYTDIYDTKEYAYDSNPYIGFEYDDAYYPYLNPSYDYSKAIQVMGNNGEEFTAIVDYPEIPFQSLSYEQFADLCKNDLCPYGFDAVTLWRVELLPNDYMQIGVDLVRFKDDALRDGKLENEEVSRIWGYIIIKDGHVVSPDEFFTDGTDFRSYLINTILQNGQVEFTVEEAEAIADFFQPMVIGIAKPGYSYNAMLEYDSWDGELADLAMKVLGYELADKLERCYYSCELLSFQCPPMDVCIYEGFTG